MKTFRDMILNESSNISPNAIEYVIRDLFKGKKLDTATKAFVKKFKGDSAFVGIVDYTYKELSDAVMNSIATDTIEIGKKYKEGMGYIAVQGSVSKYNVDADHLKDKIKEILNGDNLNGILN